MENFREHFAGFAEIDEELLAKLDDDKLFAKSNTGIPNHVLDEIVDAFFNNVNAPMKEKPNPLLMAYKSCFKVNPDLLTAGYSTEHFDTDMLKKLCSIKPAGLSELLSKDELAKLKTFVINNPEYKDLLGSTCDEKDSMYDYVSEAITTKFTAVPKYFELSFDIDNTKDVINNIYKRSGVDELKKMCITLRHKSKLMENTVYLFLVIDYIEKSDTQYLLEIITQDEMIDLCVKLLTDGYLDMDKVRNSLEKEITDLDMLVLEKFFTDMHSELSSYSNMFNMCSRVCKEYLTGGK